MRVAILGAGFGLYGYLPALLSLGQSVVLPERYRSTIAGRSELCRYLDGIEWQPDDDAALDRADALVLARRPDDQSRLLADALARPRLNRLVLEKPLARNPLESARLHAELAASGKTFRVGYTFPLTVWGQRLMALASDGAIDLAWRFRAHHYATNASNWKRRHSEGGGALRFYGIQVIALLARTGYDAVASSSTESMAPDEVETWNAVFTGNGLGSCHVTIESNVDRQQLAIESRSHSIDLADPFAELPPNDLDRRVPVLADLCREALDGAARFHDWSAAAVALWHRVEQATVHRRV